LAPEQLAALHRALGHVLTTAIEREADPTQVPASWLLPYRADGERCPRCGAELEKRAVAGRHAWLCPSCQH
jgi:formamidopyrimidine-DNA glycosylase